ncbi:ADP-ribosyltransferase [Paenibacillus thiaminolyticus]|uniref:ADP-ribosyltransferase n=1 Tax=Paenibacillus thiaminolyticus TaxID=49283 RepID=UPI0035A7290B
MKLVKLRVITTTILLSTMFALPSTFDGYAGAASLHDPFIITAFDDHKDTDKPVDFRDDKEAAKKWGEEKAKEWKLTFTEKDKINGFLDDKNKIMTKYKEISFTADGKTQAGDPFAEEIKILKDIDKALSKANLSASIHTYKNVAPAEIGFHKTLTNGNQLDPEGKKKFIEQFQGKELKFDGYLTTHLTAQDVTAAERIILKVTVPSGKGSTPTKAGLILNKNEYQMFIDNGYMLHVDKITQITQKGKECIQVEGTLKKNLDFKNDINNEADKWGKDHYKTWANATAKGEPDAPNRLNPDQLRDILGYMERDYQAINTYLRDNGKGDAALDEKIKNISEGLRKTSIPENMTVYRLCSNLEFGYEIGQTPTLEDFEGKFLNQIHEEKGFYSTSIASAGLDFGNRPLILRLHVPKGSIAAYVTALGGKTGEKEILFDKGSKYTIDKITKVTVKGKPKLVIDGTLLTK